MAGSNKYFSFSFLRLLLLKAFFEQEVAEVTEFVPFPKNPVIQAEPATHLRLKWKLSVMGQFRWDDGR